MPSSDIKRTRDYTRAKGKRDYYYLKVANGLVGAWSKGFKRRQTATAGFFPLSGRKAHHRRSEPMHLRTVVGLIKLRVWRGQDPRDQHWGAPIRERWGLIPHQQMSIALEEKLAFTATATGTYAEAALVATKWGCPVDDSVLHALVERLGSKAEGQTQQRLQALPQESQPQRRPSELAVVMVDGRVGRFRGPGWGKKNTQKERVEWHELKLGVFYLHEQAGCTEGGRGLLIDKRVVCWQGPPLEFGQRLHWEALRGGIGRAQETLVLADGGSWIWHLKADRWPKARELLDFYHGGEHLWALGRALHKDDEAKARLWVEPRLHRLRHGQEESVLAELGDLKAPGGPRGKIVRGEQNLFCRSGRTDELPGNGRPGLADWQRGGRVSLSPEPMPL